MRKEDSKNINPTRVKQRRNKKNMIEQERTGRTRRHKNG
jgi:hypothetical protein